MSAANAANAAAAWERDWRAAVMRQLQESSDAARQAAVINERTMGILNEHDRRITALEAQPAQQRQQLTLDFRMWSLIISVAAFVAAILHPSITFH
jgi:hypothetical protein